MGIEVLIALIGGSLVIAIFGRRKLQEKRLRDNRKMLTEMNFENLSMTEIEKILAKAPLLKGNGKFAHKAVGSIPYAKNFDAIRLARRLYFVEPTRVEVLLIPEPANTERIHAVAVTLDGKVLGYVPAKEASKLHNSFLVRHMGIRAMAKIYLGSRPEFNSIVLDLANPMRLDSIRRVSR